ncbi:hypothetical protein PCASD_07644 [Puccinia coronata f. sp. avenae]|uniref:Trehalose 6-phosphate phosphatase n=1 Tax=Puccinia coronata f. sp. avenae TaxID=200324 RepID=A0A2N5UN39_9BASI|nr:hypothetical protein PCASD_07644 [Puccinia coronata f. sp. avenae]
MSDIDYMTPEDSRKMREEYSQAKQRLIFIVHEDSGDPWYLYDEDYQEKINPVLSSLAADPKNEVWMVTSRRVESVEEIYGRIGNLNLAGNNGVMFSNKNKARVDLPGVLIGELANKASELMEGVKIPCHSSTNKRDFITYFVEGEEGKSDLEVMRKKLQDVVRTERYKGWEVKDIIKFSQFPAFQVKAKYSDTKRI